MTSEEFRAAAHKTLMKSTINSYYIGRHRGQLLSSTSFENAANVLSEHIKLSNKPDLRDLVRIMHPASCNCKKVLM